MKRKNSLKEILMGSDKATEPGHWRRWWWWTL